MNLLSYLKNIKFQLINKKKQNNENITDYNKDNIEVIIENGNELFENECEIIKNGASTLLKVGNVDNLEEGIIVFATIIRGLKYKETIEDQNGNLKIILCDFKPEKTIIKKK